MIQAIIKFCAIICGTLLLTFVIHKTITIQLNLNTETALLNLSYIVNALLAMLLFGVLYYYHQKKSEIIGFMYLANSGIKFLIFFIVFYPIYRADGNINKVEFAAFFIPYTIALVLETSWLVKILNKA